MLTYLWDFGDGNTSTLKNPAHAYDSAGVYTVKLTVWDPSCVDSLSRQVIIHQTPEAQIAPLNYELCARDIISLYSQTIANFSNGDVVDSLIWMISDGRQLSGYRDSSASIFFNSPGIYEVDLIAITDKGCRDTTDAPMRVVVHPKPIVELNESMINARSFNFIPDVNDADNGTYYWDFGNGDSTLTGGVDSISYRYTDRLCRIDSFINYSVVLKVVNEIENFGNCLDADTLEVSMEGYHLNVPNAFAPDRINVGDANLFLPKGRLLGEYRLRVFDEWGNIVFETTALDDNGSPLEGWDGSFNGQMMPTGAYVWTIDAQFNDGFIWPVEECNTDNIQAYGTVTLIR